MNAYAQGYLIRNVGGDFTISCTTFDGANSAIALELDASLITRPGKYVIIKSTNTITNPPTSISASFVGATSLVVRKTARETITYSDGSYDCITVSLA
jgi:hypothetical protein